MVTEGAKHLARYRGPVKQEGEVSLILWLCEVWGGLDLDSYRCRNVSICLSEGRAFDSFNRICSECLRVPIE